MNQYNMVHGFVPFISLFTALSILGKESERASYHPAVFTIISTVIILFGIFAPLKTKETAKNFMIFFPVYPIWVIAASLPALTTQVNGAIGSAFVFLIGTVFQLIIRDEFAER